MSGTATNVSGIVAIANGGTGSSTQNFVDLTTAQTISGAKIFNGNTSISGANTLTVGTGTTTLGGALGVTGATTLSSTSAHTGAATFASTVGVTGATTLTSVTATGAATFSSTVTIPTGAGANKILVSDASGNATWNANPNAAFRIASTATDNISATTDKYVIYTYAGAGTITLPAVTAAMSGKEIIIKNVSNYNVTINTTSSQAIIVDFANIAATSAIIGVEASNNWIKLIADGTNTRWIAFRALF